MRVEEEENVILAYFLFFFETNPVQGRGLSTRSYRIESYRILIQEELEWKDLENVRIIREG